MSEKRTILVIEDEKSISNFICRALTAHDYKAIPAFRGKEGLSLFYSHSPELVLLDLGLPDMDGMTILEELCALPTEVPVLIISARDRETEKVKALDIGAEDYIVKPFGVSELLARIRTILRRVDRIKLSQGTQKDVYHIKDLTVDIARHIITQIKKYFSKRCHSRTFYTYTIIFHKASPQISLLQICNPFPRWSGYIRPYPQACCAASCPGRKQHMVCSEPPFPGVQNKGTHAAG